MARDRYYKCNKCDEIGTIGAQFVQYFSSKGTSKVKHKCNDGEFNTKWAKDYILPQSSRLAEIEEEYGIIMKSMVTVKSLKKEGQLKVIGIKPTGKKIWVEVWNPDTKYSWIVPITQLKIVE